MPLLESMKSSSPLLRWVLSIVVVTLCFLVLPRVGTTWEYTHPLLQIIFLPAIGIRQLGLYLHLSEERTLIIQLLGSLPLVILYWLAIWIGCDWLLRRIALNHVSR